MHQPDVRWTDAHFLQDFTADEELSFRVYLPVLDLVQLCGHGHIFLVVGQSLLPIAHGKVNVSSCEVFVIPFLVITILQNGLIVS